MPARGVLGVPPQRPDAFGSARNGPSTRLDRVDIPVGSAPISPPSPCRGANQAGIPPESSARDVEQPAKEGTAFKECPRNYAGQARRDAVVPQSRPPSSGGPHEAAGRQPHPVRRSGSLILEAFSGAPFTNLHSKRRLKGADEAVKELRFRARFQRSPRNVSLGYRDRHPLRRRQRRTARQESRTPLLLPAGSAWG